MTCDGDYCKSPWLQVHKLNASHLVMMKSLILMCPTVTCWWVFCYKSIYHTSLKSSYRWRESDLQRIDGPGPDSAQCRLFCWIWGEGGSLKVKCCSHMWATAARPTWWPEVGSWMRGDGGNSVKHIKTSLVCTWHKHNNCYLLDMLLDMGMDITYIHYRWRLNSGCYLCRHPAKPATVWPWHHRQFAQQLSAACHVTRTWATIDSRSFHWFEMFKLNR